MKKQTRRYTGNGTIAATPIIVFVVTAIALVALTVLSFGLAACGDEKSDGDTGGGATATTGGDSGGDSGGAAGSKRLVFVHHSCGENWLSDGNGDLGKALNDAGYFVSDTNYGWGPEGIGDRTDIGNWWEWFRGPESEQVAAALYAEDTQHSNYTRNPPSGKGENEIIMFKSCFPNSALQGSPDDPVPAIGDNPLKGVGCDSEAHTVANAKGIYTDLLEYFGQHTDKLFVVVTAPPLMDTTYADNARAFNDWLANDWLEGYDSGNVAVFDFYGVLTDGGPYFSGDDHPNEEGNQKATDAFVPWLDGVYSSWKGGD